MLIGTMNHPGRDPIQELLWIAQAGFDFLDLTLEPPLAAARTIDVPRLRSALEDAGLQIVGHTAYYLPLCSPFESLRCAAVEELKYCVDAFARLGARWMNLHPDRQAPFYERKVIIERNLRTIEELLPFARDCGVGLMIENLPVGFNTAQELSELLVPIPELGLHLDLGHANLHVPANTTDELLSAHGHRLRHVHLHDNKGGSADLHLPLGTGNIDIPRYLRELQRLGYDGTITLEVFTADRNYLLYSKEFLRRTWNAAVTVTPVSARAA
jgi:sugar phosphate isomerase/epimerase